MSKVLITGVDGFTGRYLAAALSGAGHEVHGIVHKELSSPLPGLHQVHACDLLDTDRLQHVVNDVQPDRVAHLAAISFVGYGDAGTIYQVNIVGTRNLLEALVQAGHSLDAVLIASSANVYGNQAEGIIAEEAQLAPANDYAVSKVATEYVSSLYDSRLPVIIVRPFNYTGAGQSISFLVPKIIDHVRRREPLIELGNIDVSRDFSDVRDVVSCYESLLKRPAAIGKTLNVCSGEAHSLEYILKVAQEISGHTLEVKINPAFVRTNEVKYLRGDREKLTTLLEDFTTRPLRETIEWMIRS